MADLKISQFADGNAVQPTDEIATNRAGTNTKVFVGSAAAYDVGNGIGELPEFLDNGSGLPIYPDADFPYNASSGSSITSDTLQGAIEELDQSFSSLGTAAFVDTGIIANHIPLIDGYLSAGTYTPSWTPVTNASSATPYQCQWLRNGNVVNVSGRVNAIPSSSGFTVVECTLPISSNILSLQNCSGAAVRITAPGIAAESASISGNASTDRAAFSFIATSSGDAHNFYFVFQYLIQ